MKFEKERRQFAFKGLSHEMDLAFDDMYDLGLNRGRGQFLNFLAAQMIL